MIVILFNKIIYRCRWLFWRKKFGSYKSRLLLGKKITFKHPECLHFGANVGIGKYSYFLPVTKYAGVNYQPKITIGDRCSIGIRNSFACIHSIEIGDDVLFAGYVHITDHSHGYEEIETPISEQKLICKGGIKIEEQCWLGFGCEVLSGVHIGRHSIVAARSVVTKDVLPYTIVAGNPARIIKQYNFSSKKWEKVK